MIVPARSSRTPSVVGAPLASTAVGSVGLVVVRLIVARSTVRVVGRLVSQDASWLVLTLVDVAVAPVRTAVTVAIEADAVVESAYTFNIKLRVSLIVLTRLSWLLSSCRFATFKMSLELLHVILCFDLVNNWRCSIFDWGELSSSMICQFEVDVLVIAPIQTN